MSTSDVNTPRENRPTRGADNPFSLVKPPHRQPSTGAGIFDEIFEPALHYREEDFHTVDGIKAEAALLSKTIRNLSFLEIPFTETSEVRDFIEAYRTKLEIINSDSNKVSHANTPLNSLRELFRLRASSVLTALELRLVEIERESFRAFELRDQEPNELDVTGLPRIKATIDCESGDLGRYLRQIDSLSGHTDPRLPRHTLFTRGDRVS